MIQFPKTYLICFFGCWSVRCFSFIQLTMITGDNPLTACHVARELRLTRREIVVLSPPESTNNHGNLLFIALFFLLTKKKRRILAWLADIQLNWALNTQPTNGCGLFFLFWFTFILYFLLVSILLSVVESEWHWQPVDRSFSLPIIPSGGARELTSKFDLCVTGQVSCASHSLHLLM